MNNIKRKFIIYKTADNKEPFIDWLDSIKDRATKNRILTRLDRLYLGNFGDYKSVGDDVYELRLHFGPGYRIYYSEINKIIILLLSGGTKKQQETDIQQAREYLKDYKESINEKL